MSDQEGVFRFELNETLYFESGQEVAEIIGISLDPEISIQTFHEYISIRGIIELSGDYHKVQLPDTLDDEPFEVNEYHEKNFIEQVTDKTDTHAAFVHRFPVEISIPSYRVNDLEEVTVQVASFDYVIPNHHQMKLMATIEIEGIIEQSTETSDEPETPDKQEESVKGTQNETQDELQETEESDIDHNEELVDEVESESTEADKINVVDKTEIEENDIVDAKVETEENDVVDAKVEAEENDKEEVEQNEDIAERESPAPVQKEAKKSKKSLLLSDFFKIHESKNTDEDESTQEELELNENTSSEQVSDDNEDEEIIKTNEQGMENEQSQTPIHSLSDMFEHDSEDKYTKMRLCIVQDDDTIETIAERYEITTNQLILKNRLNDESIIQGQLLYIPEKISR